MQLRSEITVLLCLTAVLIPLSKAIFRYALRKIRRDGSALQY